MNPFQTTLSPEKHFMLRLILIRHGETEWNVEGRYQGQADPHLNLKGRRQARALAKKLHGLGLELLISSPLKRAAQTAQILGENLELPVIYDHRLMEIHQGDWQTRLRSEIEERYPDLFHRWETEPWQVTPPNGENLYQVQSRVNEFLNELVGRYPDACIGIITHRIPIAMIKMRYQGLQTNIVRTLRLPNTFFEEIMVD
jgi:broad specificity phosphatase PhoE